MHDDNKSLAFVTLGIGITVLQDCDIARKIEISLIFIKISLIFNVDVFVNFLMTFIFVFYLYVPFMFVTVHSIYMYTYFNFCYICNQIHNKPIVGQG